MKKNSLKKKKNFANFGNLQSGLKRRLICQLFKKYKKFKFVKFLNFRNLQIVLKIAKCINLSRNMKKIRAWRILQDNLTLRQMCWFVENNFLGQFFRICR